MSPTLQLGDFRPEPRELAAALRKEGLLVGAYVCPTLWNNNDFWAPDAMFGERKSSEVFFRLHELQVKSWGASTVGGARRAPARLSRNPE